MGENIKLEVPQHLRANILAQIRQGERHSAKIYLITSCVVMPAAFFSIVFSLQYTIQELYSSNFYNFFLLLLSDTDMMFAYWQEIIFSLTETIPLVGATAV